MRILEMVLGIISFCISAVFFVMAFFSEFVTHQMSYLMGWLGFGIAGFGFLILEKLDKLSVKNYPYSANKSENMSIKSKVEVKEAYNPSCPNCKIPLRIEGDHYMCMTCLERFNTDNLQK